MRTLCPKAVRGHYRTSATVLARASSLNTFRVILTLIIAVILQLTFLKLHIPFLHLQTLQVHVKTLRNKIQRVTGFCHKGNRETGDEASDPARKAASSFNGENRNGRQGKHRQRQEGTTEEGQTDSERETQGEAE